jgi:hypothetical protein
MYQTNIIFFTCVFLLFGCMDQRKFNNEADAVSSLEKKKENTSTRGITFKKNADGKHVLYEGSFFNLGKKEANQVGLPNSTDIVATDENGKKTGLADVFANLWSGSKMNDELTDQNFQRSPANVGSSGIDTVPKKRKSMLEQFTTIVWPWEKIGTENPTE